MAVVPHRDRPADVDHVRGTGSDSSNPGTTPGAGLHRELERLESAGLAPPPHSNDISKSGANAIGMTYLRLACEYKNAKIVRLEMINSSSSARSRRRSIALESAPARVSDSLSSVKCYRLREGLRARFTQAAAIPTPESRANPRWMSISRGAARPEDATAGSRPSGDIPGESRPFRIRCVRRAK
jgi:hypothetical protein